MDQRRAVAFPCWIPVAACAIAASSGAGCAPAGDEPAGAAPAVRHVRVTQADVSALPPGERLRLDLGAARVAYHVALDPALDAERILLVSAEGAEASLAAEIEAIERRAAEPLAAVDGRLVLTGDPAAFEELDAAELSALRARGELVKEIEARSPGARPQSTDPCGRSGVYLGSDLQGGAAPSVWSSHVALICEVICAPGATEACYGGPAVTQGVGACQEGQRACNLTGTAWGPCTGEVRPASEACTSTTDVDCNGAVGCVPGHLWSKLFGDANAQSGTKLVYDLATDAAGNLLLTGSFSRSLPVGSQTLVGGRAPDAFVIKLDPAGNVLWARSFGGDGTDMGVGIATDASGDVLVTGTFWNTVDFGAGPLVSAGKADVFVLRLDANGTTLWSQRYGNPDAQQPEAIAVGPGGEITVAGRYYGPIDFGQGPLPASDITKTFVLRLDPGGVPLWSRGFDVEYVMWPKDLAVDASSGDVVLAGWTQGWVDLGGGPVSGAGGEDGFVVRLASSSGATVWGKTIGGPEDDQVTGAALDGAGGLVVAGWFGGQVSLGGGATLTSTGSTDALVAKLDAGSGGVLWSEALGNASAQDASAVALDAAGNIALLGHYRGAVDLGGGLMTSFTDFSMSRYLAKLDPAGSLLWSRGYAFQTYSLLHGAEEERGLAVDAAGNVFFSGVAFDSAWSVEYGGGLLTPLGNMDFVVAKYAP
ncbi:hypothetical protein [Sorangium sp. So ce1099]|uniref:hypothetical protein n=1 Tax=Sorangium sp. So ce1099 TaxID=3133331 RepID=UPI003F5FA8A8